MYKAALCAASVKAFSDRFKEFAAGLLATLMMHMMHYMTLVSAANSEMFLPHAQKEFVYEHLKDALSSLIQ